MTLAIIDAIIGVVKLNTIALGNGRLWMLKKDDLRTFH